MAFPSFIIILLALGTLTHFKEGIKTYPVKKITGEIAISGKGDHPLWKRAHELSDFSYPWETETPPSTKFKALHSDAWLYCLFDVMDHDIRIHVDKNHKTEVASSCRAEIFLKKDDQLSPYYCLEIDPMARVLDYEGQFHRKFNMKWSWPQGHLLIKSHRRKNGYSIEIAISKASLKELGLLKDKNLQTGLYRADCLELNENGERFKWTSWVKPDSPTPDFHIPSSFGLLQLED
jgi:hypothetical protein